MKTVYVKTTWIDDKTPVNAANLNKIENAISDLYINSLSSSEFLEGDGIKISLTNNKSLEFSVSDKVLQSESVKRIEVIQDNEITSEDDLLLNVLYFILDSRTKKLKKIVMNGVSIYEMEQ